MATITTLTENLADLRDAVSKERDFATAERTALLGTVGALRDGLNQLEASLNAAFQERDQVLLSLLGGNPA